MNATDSQLAEAVLVSQDDAIAEPSNIALIAFLCMLAAATALVVAGKLTGAEWVDAMFWTVAACVLGKPVDRFAAGYASSVVHKAANTVAARGANQ